MVVTTRIMFQRVATPTDGTDGWLKRNVPLVSQHPRGVLFYPSGGGGQSVKSATRLGVAMRRGARVATRGGYVEPSAVAAFVEQRGENVAPRLLACAVVRVFVHFVVPRHFVSSARWPAGERFARPLSTLL